MMYVLLFLYTILQNTEVVAANNANLKKALPQKFSNVSYSGVLPPIDTKQRSRSEDSIATNSTSSLSSLSSSSSSAEGYITPIPSQPSTPQSSKSSYRRKAFARNSLRKSPMTVQDQSKVDQAYRYVSEIQNPIIHEQARNAVENAATANDKEQLAAAWEKYLSNIEDDTAREEAAQEVQITPTLFKQNMAAIWLNYLVQIPEREIRSKAIADIKNSQSSEEKELMAKIWAKFLSQITNENVQARAAAAVRRAPYHSKELLAEKWLETSKTDYFARHSAAMKKQPEHNSWWKILSEIKDWAIKDEARQYIEYEISDPNQRIQMANVWVQYLAKIDDKPFRDAVFEKIKRIHHNYWEDIASEQYLQYVLQQVKS